MFSDGKMNFSPIIGGRPLDVISKDSYTNLIRLLKKLIGYTRTSSPNSKIVDFNTKYNSTSIRFIEVEQAHIGSDNLQQLIRRLIKYFSSQIISECDIVDIRNKNGLYELVSASNEQIHTKQLVVATGQKGSHFASIIANSFSVQTKNSVADIGIRLETKKEILEPLTNIQYDPKIYFDYGNYSVRTFCTNPGGDVILEKKNDYISINGYANSTNDTPYTNTALMCQITGLKDPKSYSENLCKKISKITNRKIAIQDISTILIKNSKSDFPVRLEYSFQDIDNLYPKDISKVLKETLRKLNSILGGNLQGYIYMPEIKLYNSTINIQKDTFQSSQKGLYFIGDCCGTIHGLTNACLSGLSFATNFINDIHHEM